MSIPDRSKSDTEVSQSLLIFAAHHALIAENQRLSQHKAELLQRVGESVQERDRLINAHEDTLHTLTRVEGMLEATQAELTATRDRELALIKRLAGRTTQPRIRLTRGEMVGSWLMAPVVAWERLAPRWWALWAELTAREHRGWLIFALGVGGLFLTVVAMGGKW